jgi:lysyl-tRNA synthetase class 2
VFSGDGVTVTLAFVANTDGCGAAGGDYICLIGARFRFLNVRQSAALAVAVLAIEAVLSGIALPDARYGTAPAGLEPSGLPSEVHILSVLIGLALLATTARLWRGTRTAVSLAILGLMALATLNLAKGRWGEASVELSLAALLSGARSSFPLGCRNRPRVAMVATAVGAWGLAYCALHLAPLVHGRAHGLVHALHGSVTHALRLTAAAPHMNAVWSSTIDVLIGCAAVTSGLAVRSLLRPAAAENHHVEHEYRAARAIVGAHGEDSLSPFILRPDKALQFGAGGVLSYRVIRGTAIVSSDPVGPPGAAPRVLASFLEVARRRGWQVALWGASDRHLDAYRRLGLRAVCVGEEAFVDPRRFTLEGRAVRKLRQSVNRVQRRGWTVVVREGRGVDAALEAEIDGLERAWRRGRRLYGFAMGMGGYDTELCPDDLYVLARSPTGELGAAMRFVSHCGKLSLDTMRRVGATPNGLNEALVCRALEVAREAGVTQVSLNYAGLAHLVRGTPPAGRLQRWGRQLLLAALGRHFQMERLVRFNEKFSPEWRPRYLVYESRGALPRTVVRVLQAEGYLPERGRLPLPRGRVALPGALGRSPHAPGAG